LDQSLEGNIVTTIDPEVQKALEDQLKSVTEKYSSQMTAGVIINPQNGEIYALGGYPTFDPNDYGKFKMETYTNPIIKGRYELGSIAKALTVASGLDTGIIKATTLYNDTGCTTLNKKTFCNYDGKKRGMIPIQEVLNQSLNVGAAHVVKMIGNKTFADYFKSFGFDRKTNIDLPEEVTGNIHNLSSKNDIEYATASFGQGISLTPIQMARALCVLGNGGYLITPHIVKKVEYEIGGSKNIDLGKGEQVLKTSTSEEISRMLTIVVDKALKGGIYKHDHYSIAAKTGTAQMANPNGGGYYKDRYLHSFFGYFPSYNPKFLVLLFTVDPKNVNYASDTLTIPFMAIADFLLNYYQVPPDR
jgi:cell division protein FtsI/penicillin-binding protein 2